ncbi:hypothetical protein FOQG_14659 [Fusarium oxysporum f. sp. raphani 54005]|uniref:Uncharacterized protein n=2 Tax=Fusarium oxysporum TaxID=5507 RepID=X0CE29_FUSOX|nr:hypothetical protein FOMG_17997 [Fusarium oxysporum f. sp. melonis 26406]EXK80887.1 hypothetical protein FOQG_14659 [Fusarium oxysporum f. sp. raphani 54005]
MPLPCLAPLISRLSHLSGSNSWTDQTHPTQGRVEIAFRRRSINLWPFKKKNRTHTPRYEADNLTPRQQETVIEDGISSQVVPVSVNVLTMPRQVDRACQTDLRPTSALSTYELVSVNTLDECTTPDGRQPPPPPPPYTPGQVLKQ